MPTTAHIDKQSCLSSGRCAEAAPDAFGADADHLGEVLPGAGNLPVERLLEIARRCPGLAIALRDGSGREIDLEG